MRADEPRASEFKIGAVARVTGVPVETLRAWERRYQVVTPHRAAGGSRLYGQQDVARLLLIKRLVDAGNAISTIAQLSLEQLEERVSSSGVLQEAQKSQNPARVSIIGPTLPVRLTESLDATYVDVVNIMGRYSDIEQFQREAVVESLDGLVIEVPVLIQESVPRLRRLRRMSPHARIIVVYGYGKRESVRQLEALGITPMQQPLSWSELIEVLGCGHAAPGSSGAQEKHVDVMGSPVPTRRFDDNQLALIASVTTNIDCECPHHVANLVLSLNHFELYSAECENLSDEDAALHAYLHRATSQARSLMESALQLVIETDGIEIEGIPTGAEVSSAE